MFKPRVHLFVLLLSLLVCSPLWAGESYWIDVRSPDEYATGHVEGSVNIPHTEIADRIGEVTQDKSKPLYLYCRSGRRSGIAMDVLQQMGYANAINVGGYEDARKKAAKIAQP